MGLAAEQEFEPIILALACNWCSYTGADLAGISRCQYPANVRIIRVMCSGMVHPNLVIDALEMAWCKRNPGKNTELIFHSDRGSQYASEDFREVLKEHGITPSMSRKGNCWDNACSETLFGSLKVERLHGQRFATIREAKDEVIAWLLWYNRTRMHSTLNYVSPVQFEQDWMDATEKIAA